MPDVQRCQRCGSRVILHGVTELDATPDPAGYWAIGKDGTPVVAVVFSGGQVVGRAKGFEKAVTYRGHWGTCAAESAKKAQGLPGRKAAS